MTETMEKARALLGEDNISEEVFDIIEGPDRKGNYLLACGTKRMRTHPSRILKINPEGAPVYRTATTLCVACPECEEEVLAELGSETAQCDDHGSFPIDWSEVDSGPSPATPEQLVQPKLKTKPSRVQKPRSPKPARKSKTPALIPFDIMKKAGEVWIKQAPFDYPEYTLEPIVFIIWGDNARKMTFNSYSGTWGKHSHDDKVHAFIDGSQKTGRNDWHPITKSADAIRKKLEKDGYQRVK